MQSLGSLMVFLGVGSFLLHFANMELVLVSWVDNWGVSVGNGIRVAMILVGGILWLVGKQSKQTVPPQG